MLDNTRFLVSGTRGDTTTQCSRGYVMWFQQFKLLFFKDGRLSVLVLDGFLKSRYIRGLYDGCRRCRTKYL